MLSVLRDVERLGKLVASLMVREGRILLGVAVSRGSSPDAEASYPGVSRSAPTGRPESSRRILLARKLYVGGLSFDTTDETLRTFFEQVGKVDSASVVTDRFSGRSRGFGFVEMATAAESRKAIGELTGKTLDGRTITVDEARPPQQRGGGGGGRRPGGGGGGRSGGGRRW
jgi:RNA recognition motif-containing protein